MSQKTNKIPQLTQEEKDKASSIMLSVEIESNFKLYSYRIITHQQFTARVNELIQHYQNNTKKIPTPSDNGQLDLVEEIENHENS